MIKDTFKDLKYKPVAIELFSSARCNMKCSYCYIPKDNQLLDDKHLKIIDEAKKVTPLIDRLKTIYGKEVTGISHWGTEPSLTLQHFKDFYKVFLKEFPNIESIMFSSNFLSKVHVLIDFIRQFPTDKKISFSVQASLDGPPWITDNNRGAGSTKRIIENVSRFVRELNEADIQHAVKVSFKPTVSSNQYDRLSDYQEIVNYYTFFDDVFKQLFEANFNNRVGIITSSCDFTLVAPSQYTTHDGKVFNKLYKHIIRCANTEKLDYIKPEFAYYYSFLRLTRVPGTLFTRQREVTCGAGDSMFGINENLNICHDTFYSAYPGVKEAFKKDLTRLNADQELENITSGRYDILKDHFIFELDKITKKQVKKFVYTLRGLHDFSKFKISFLYRVAKEMAHCGQISACYKTDAMAELLAIFVCYRLHCIISQITENGSMHLHHTTYLKLFGNGVLENFLKRYLNDK